MGDIDGPYQLGSGWTAPDGTYWELTFWLKEVSGRPECIGFGMMSSDGSPLKVSTLRGLPFASELDRAWRGEETMADHLGHSPTWQGGEVPAELPPTKRGTERQRARYTTADLQRVAAVYRELWEARSKAPTRGTANALGLRPDQAAKLVQRCRRMGLLPQTERGVPRGSAEEVE